MHHWEGLKFGRRDWKKTLWKFFFMKSSFSFIAPCMQRYSAPTLKEPFIGCLSVCFSKIQRKGREARVHASLVGQMLRNVPQKAQVIRPLNFLQAVASRSFCSMPLAGHSPTLPLVVLCNLFLTPVRVCGQSSAGTRLLPAHPGCIYVVWMCYLLAGQMLKHHGSRCLLTYVSAGLLPPPWQWG